MKKLNVFLLSVLLLAAAAVPGLAYRVYRVQPGNTVGQIAAWHGLTTQRLVEANRLPNPGHIIPRQVLLIPNPTTGPDEQLHQVRSGESLHSLAVRYGTSVNWMLERNSLRDGVLYAGQIIKVPGKTTEPAPPSPASEPAPTVDPPEYIWNIPDLMARHPGHVFLSGPANERKVALTFDDGPDAVYTPAILDTLAELGVKATFFLNGNKIPGREWVVERIINEGHVIGNHSHTHANLRKLNMDQFRAEISRTEELIRSLTGLRTALLRPPYGEMSEAGLDWMVGQGYRMINWSVDSNDWRAAGVDKILINTLPDLRPGSIILFHSAGGEGQDMTSSVKATEDLIYTLWGLGYEINTLPELLSVSAYR